MTSSGSWNQLFRGVCDSHTPLKEIKVRSVSSPWIDNTIRLKMNYYEAFRNKKQVPPTAQTKLKEIFTHFSVDWKEIYSLPFTVTIETNIREFQYKIFNNIIFTNKKLFKLKMNICVPFFKRENESLEHLFFNGYVTKFFWEAFCSWLIECSISLQPLTLTDIVFGIFNVKRISIF